MTIKELKKGEFFTLKPIAEPKESQVYIRDEYNRTSKKYLAIRWDDINRFRHMSPDTVVYTEFTF